MFQWNIQIMALKKCTALSDDFYFVDYILILLFSQTQQRLNEK